MKLNEKNIFLLDGIGALLSAFPSGVVLPMFSQWLGFPMWILYGLAVLGLAYASYSLSCYFLAKRPVLLLLSGIISANVLYCLLMGVIFVSIDGLTTWGRAVLVADAIVISSLIAIETKVYRHAYSQPLVNNPSVLQ